MIQDVNNFTTIVTESSEITISHDWEIRNFHKLSVKKKKGESIKSVIFSSDLGINDRWRIYCYPNGVTNDDEKYVGIKLRLLSSNEKIVIAHYTLSIVSESERAKSVTTSKICRFKSGDVRGPNRFIRKKKMLNYFLFYDVLTVRCSITMFVRENIEFADGNPPRIRGPLDNTLLYEYLEQKSGDVTFVIDGKELKAHSGILSRASKKFEEMLEGNYKRKIYIKHSTFEGFQQLLNYIYTAKFDMNFTDSLIIPAYSYKLNTLKAICEKHLMRSLRIDNAALLLNLAVESRSREMKCDIVNFIRRHLEDVKATHWYRVLKNEFPKLRNEIMRINQ